MIRSILFVALFWLYMVRLTPPLILVTLRKRRLSREQVRAYGFRTSHGWTRIQLAVLKPRITVRGTDKTNPDEPILIVSNHQGEFDIPLLFHTVKRPFGFIAKTELRKVPLVGPWMDIIGCQFVDRNDPADVQAIVGRTVDALKAGDSLAIFPEGTRSDGPTMRRFKTGFARMAIRSGATILPVTVSGTYRMKQRGSYRIQPADVTITLGDPVSVEGYELRDVARLTREVEATIRAGLDVDEDESA